ncbi:hypothetical protein OB446_009345, partial [Paenibacillus alvei]|uniref:hypothetical protein n=1 Tax=Paenibacillus alvei TaxID=44250 RepID=UPI0021D31141
KFELLISFDEVLLPHSQTLLVVQFSKNNLHSSASAYRLFRFRSPRLSAATHIIYHAHYNNASIFLKNFRKHKKSAFLL